MKRVALSAILTLAVAAHAGEPDRALLAKCLHPTVRIECGPSTGTGVVVSSRKDGDVWRNIVFTVAHVVEAEKIDVHATIYHDWSKATSVNRHAASIQRVDRKKDIAVLAFWSYDPLPVADVEWDAKLYVGNRVVRVGCGLGMTQRLEFGHITEVDGTPNVSTLKPIRISSPGYPGDSGGPVFEGKKLVGLFDSIRTRVDYDDIDSTEMIGFAVPVKDAFTTEDLLR